MRHSSYGVSLLCGKQVSIFFFYVRTSAVDGCRDPEITAFFPGMRWCDKCVRHPPGAAEPELAGISRQQVLGLFRVHGGALPKGPESRSSRRVFITGRMGRVTISIAPKPRRDAPPRDVGSAMAGVLADFLCACDCRH